MTDALYHVEDFGASPSSVRAVEDAMKWLLSPAAGGLGQELLSKIHEKTGKPAHILVSHTLKSHSRGAQTIINPLEIAEMMLPDEAGVLRVASIERVLAHELTHSGKEGGKRLLEINKNARKRRREIREELFFDRMPEEVKREATLKGQITTAPDYPTALQHVEEYVDAFSLPMEKAFQAACAANSDIRFLEAHIEGPALEAENRVAALRGEPLHHSHNFLQQMTPEHQRQMLIRDVAKRERIDLKPGAPSPEQDLWSGWLAKERGAGKATGLEPGAG